MQLQMLIQLQPRKEQGIAPIQILSQFLMRSVLLQPRFLSGVFFLTELTLPATDGSGTTIAPPAQ